MFGFLKKRIHESLALSAIFASSIALHVAWLDNLLISKSALIRDLMTINFDIGPVSGLYLDTTGAFFLALFLSIIFWRGKDVSHWRNRVFWFFIASIVFFVVMTMPFVFGFEVGGVRSG